MHCYPIYLLPPPLGGWQMSEAFFYPINLHLHTVFPQKNTNLNNDEKVFVVEYPSLHCEYGLLSLINKAVD